MKSLISSILLLTLCISCKEKNENIIKEISLDVALSAKASNAIADSLKIIPFSFCEMITIKQWDEMLVITPYTNMETIKAKNLGNFKKISNTLENNSISDDKCTLVFLLKNDIIAYATTIRLPIDFSGLLDNSSQKGNASFLRKDCGNLYLEKSQYKYQTKFIVHIRNSKNSPIPR